jgi:hypothetical protein
MTNLGSTSAVAAGLQGKIEINAYNVFLLTFGVSYNKEYFIV